MGLILAVWMYGMVLCMFASTIRPLWNRRHRGKLVLVITICLLITSTANIAVSIGKAYSGFISHRESPGVVEYFSGWTVYDPLSSFFLAAAVVTADSLLIFRLFTIWSQNRWIVAAPIGLVLIECVAAILLCVMSAMPSKAAYSSDFEVHVVAILLSGACTILVNLICTPCIVGRLWWVGRQGHAMDSRNYYTVVIVRLVEGGSLYTITLFVWIVFQVMPTYPAVGQLTNYIFIMIIAIAPMLIVLHLNSTTASEMNEVVYDGPRSDGQGGQAIPALGVGSTTIAFRPMGCARTTQDSHTTQDISSFRPTQGWNRSELEDEEKHLDDKMVPVDYNALPELESGEHGIREPV
ncbi:hypothetical protein FRB94_002773 [Tulasnella sp. JGI-2019a]|nr:hypothetical protein FRB94_002773 [Tulasnella sp. JGI-2019a]